MNEVPQALIQIEGLTKVFYTDEVETHALSGVHLSVNKGEYVAMSGPSGCGKSTLLSIIGLLDTPSSGRYPLNGRTVENLDFAERSRIRNQEIGFIFQSFNLIGDLTVYENVELPLTYRQKHAGGATKDARDGSARARRHGASRPALSFTTLWRSAATRRRGPSSQRQAFHPAGRRAHWKPGLAQRRGGDGVAAGTASRWRDHLHGDARSALRQACAAGSASFRRQGRG